MKQQHKIILLSSIGLAAGIGLGFLLLKKDSVIAAIESAVWDYRTENKIKQLHPSIRNRVRAFINEAAAQGIMLRVTSGYRSWEEQQSLYNQGRTTPGDIVTNALPGSSFHNYGLGFDVVEMINGQPQWNGQWTKISKIGKSYGFQWGGDWNSIDDKPHFHDSFGNSIASLKSKYNNGQLTNGYLNVA